MKWRTSVLSAYNYRQTLQRQHLHTFPLWCSRKFNRISREEETVGYHLICFHPAAPSHRADLGKSWCRRITACIPQVKKQQQQHTLHVIVNDCDMISFIVLLKICLRSDNLDHHSSSRRPLGHGGAIPVWEPDMISWCWPIIYLGLWYFK